MGNKYRHRLSTKFWQQRSNEDNSNVRKGSDKTESLTLITVDTHRYEGCAKMHTRGVHR